MPERRVWAMVLNSSTSHLRTRTTLYLTGSSMFTEVRERKFEIEKEESYLSGRPRRLATNTKSMTS